LRDLELYVDLSEKPVDPAAIILERIARIREQGSK
jgi:hypothetical protein